MGRRGIKTRATDITHERKAEEILPEKVEKKEHGKEVMDEGSTVPEHDTAELEEEIMEDEVIKEVTKGGDPGEEEEWSEHSRRTRQSRKRKRDTRDQKLMDVMEKIANALSKQATPKPHMHYNTAPLHMNPWSGGRGYKEFKQEFESKSAGSAWSDEMKVTRLAGHLRGLVAIRYKEWLEKGVLREKPMSDVWRLIEKEMVNMEEENELDREAWEQRTQHNAETVQEFYEVFMDGAARAEISESHTLTSRFVKNLKKEVARIIRPALIANPELSLSTLMQMARQAEGWPSGKIPRNRNREWAELEDDHQQSVIINALARDTTEVKARLEALEALSQTKAAKHSQAEEKGRVRPEEEKETTQALVRQLVQQVSRMAVQLGTARQHQDNGAEVDHEKERRVGKCYRCNEAGHIAKECQKEVQCTVCHKTGHVEATCFRKPKSKHSWRNNGPSRRSRYTGEQ